MKLFSIFVKEAFSTAVQQATRMGLRSDGHGGYHDGNGEFVAKDVQGKLVFYNKRQRPGKDPAQTPKEKRLSAPTPANAPPITESELRELYIAKEIFNEGDCVESLLNGNIGKIIRRGANHLICVTEDGEMFKSWIKDVKEYTEVKMDTPMRDKIHPTTLVGAKGTFINYASKTPGAVGTNSQYLQKGGKAYGIDFINKYRKK